VIRVADLPAEVRAAAGGPPRAPIPSPCPAPAPAPFPSEAGPAPATAGAPWPLAAAGDPGREGLLHALQASSWKVTRTALALQVSRQTLYRWLRKYGIER
jgi:transcriptional regulator of acetoin/glycerol metabolism